MFYPEFIAPQKLFINDDISYLFDVVEKHGGILRFVGGFVRDTIAGYNHTDIDLVTDLSPAEFADICDEEDIKCVPIGLHFFSLGVIINNSFFKVTTLGLEDDNIKDVWQIDAAKRDLTINAVYADNKGNVFDYFGGIQDLKDGVIKFIGRPKKAIERNYIHIMRFFRFCAMFGKKIDKKSLKACIENKKLLQQVSPEKIKEELFKIIMAPYAPRALDLVFKYSVLDFLFASPKSTEKLKALSELETALGIEKSLIRRIFVLFEPSEARVNRLANIFNFNKNQKEHLLSLCRSKLKKESFKDTVTTNQTLYLFDKNVCLDMFLLSHLKDTDINLLQKKFKTLSSSARPVFPLSGKDLLKINADNTFLGVYIDALKQKWFESGCSLTKKELIEEFRKIFKYNV